MSASGGTVGQQGTPVLATTNGANTPLASTLPAVPGKTNFVSGIEITSTGATAGGVVQATISGVIGGPIPYVFAVPAGATLGAQPLVIEFNPPLPATGPNVAVALNVPAVGAGATNTTACIHGYVL